jgi:tetratricopeptide (TPR) repeat protein
MASQLDEFRRTTSSVKNAGPELNPERIEQLQALGYVTGFTRSGAAAKDERGPDPKEKIPVANLLHAALLAMEDDHYQEAIPPLEQVLKQEPLMPLANLELGRALSSVGNYDKALPWLRKAVQLTPESGRARVELGMAMAETEDWAGSAEQLEAAVAHAPDSDELRFDLATAYDHLDRVADATQAFQAALRLNPNHYRANLMLGRLIGMHGNPLSAVPYLQKAAQLQPLSPDAHKFLANVYTELGREGDAAREQAEAKRLGAIAPQ